MLRSLHPIDVVGITTRKNRLLKNVIGSDRLFGKDMSVSIGLSLLHISVMFRGI